MSENIGWNFWFLSMVCEGVALALVWHFGGPLTTLSALGYGLFVNLYAAQYYGAKRPKSRQTYK